MARHRRALREADVGVAMGASGSDVARAAADLVLLDDHFASIVTAIRLGRATFANVRRFLTYHLTDNVAELAPFAVWALSGGSIPLAIGVLQVLPPGRNRVLLVAVAAEVALLVVFLGVPQVADVLGGSWPSTQGWLYATGAAVVLAVDTIAKLVRRAARKSAAAARPRVGFAGSQ